MLNDDTREQINKVAQFIYDAHTEEINKAAINSIIYGKATKISWVDGRLKIESLPIDLKTQIQPDS